MTAFRFFPFIRLSTKHYGTCPPTQSMIFRTWHLKLSEKHNSCHFVPGFMYKTCQQPKTHISVAGSFHFYFVHFTLSSVLSFSWPEPCTGTTVNDSALMSFWAAWAICFHTHSDKILRLWYSKQRWQSWNVKDNKRTWTTYLSSPFTDQSKVERTKSKQTFFFFFINWIKLTKRIKYAAARLS